MTSPPRPAGVIHDLAYQRYEGARLGANTRFLVIARYAVRAQWRLRAVKLFLIGALMCAGIGAASVGFAWLMDHRTRGLAVTAALGAQWLPALLLMLVCGAPAVAADLNAGAFQFHFARPVSAGQYLAGRMLAAVAWPAVFGYGTLVLYCSERFAFHHDPLELVKIFGVGVLVVTARLATLGAVALGCSSLTRRKGLAQVMFIAMVMGSDMLGGIVALKTQHDWVLGLSVRGSSSMLCDQLLGEVRLKGLEMAAAPLAAVAWAAGFLAIAWVRVQRAEVVRG